MLKTECSGYFKMVPFPTSPADIQRENLIKILEVGESPGSPVVRTWGLHCRTHVGLGSIPDWGTKILQAMRPKKIKNKKSWR